MSGSHLWAWGSGCGSDRDFGGLWGTVKSSGQKDHINLRILDSGSQAQDKGDSRNPGLWDSRVCVCFFGPAKG